MYVQEMYVVSNRTAMNKQLRHRYGTSLGFGSGIRTVALILLTAAAIFSISASSAISGELTVSVDSVDGLPGDLLPVRILLDNSLPIASIIVPLRFNPGVLFPDSVTFAGSAVNPDHQYLSTFSSDSNLVRILVLPTLTKPMPVINDPGGLLATIWFSISPFAVDGFSELDTAYVLDSVSATDGYMYFYPEELQASDAHGTQLYPDFLPGGILIRTRIK